MNSEQINLVRRSFEKISSEAFAESFYNQLFSIQPALRLLFPDDFGERREKLMPMLEAVIEMLDEPEKLIPFLEETGRRHALDGMREEHYETVGTALFAALREMVGADFTGESEAAWTQLYEVMSEIMKLGARRLSGGSEQNQKKNTEENSMKIFKQAKFMTKFIFLIFIFAVSSFAQTTAFTYQGKLNDGALAANGPYLLEFKLFDTQLVGAGAQVGATISDVSATVVNGVFTVQLDFGANSFDGADRFLEISVRRNAGESYVTLAPRQPLSSVPYAIKSKSAETAVTATNATNATSAANADTLDGIDSTGFVPANTTLFIRNQTGQQSSSNFNVSGTGTANILNATTQFNLNGTRILSAPGTANLFVGKFTGNSSTTGNGNSFVGTNTGNSLTTGTYNSFVGVLTGFNNTTGNQNSFVGAYAGFNNSAGDQNSFFGAEAGSNNTIGAENSFVGTDAGYNNSTGNQNSFLGNRAGFGNTTGFSNSFVGVFAGYDNTTGSRNTIIGYSADVGASNLSYATAIGAEAVVSTSNTIALGRISGADRVIAYGLLQVNTLGAAGSISLCRNASNQISTCSSSLRYKTNINPFNSGLSIINRLKPITFDWKDGGMKDLGLGAEDVAAVDENLVIRNEKGEVEGVKYDRLGVVLINAVKQQQSQIEAQQKLLEDQAQQIELLKQLVCSQNPNAEICKGGK
jgi:hemoglobin-like flavoprotein